MTMTLDEFETRLDAICSAYEQECIAAGKKYAAALDPLIEEASNHLSGGTLAALASVRMKQMGKTIAEAGDEQARAAVEEGR